MAVNQLIEFAQNRDMIRFVANNFGVHSDNGNEWNKHESRSGKEKQSLAFVKVPTDYMSAHRENLVFLRRIGLMYLGKKNSCFFWSI